MILGATFLSYDNLDSLITKVRYGAIRRGSQVIDCAIVETVKESTIKRR